MHGAGNVPVEVPEAPGPEAPASEAEAPLDAVAEAGLWYENMARRRGFCKLHNIVVVLAVLVLVWVYVCRQLIPAIILRLLGMDRTIYHGMAKNRRGPQRRVPPPSGGPGAPTVDYGAHGLFIERSRTAPRGI